MKLTFSLQQLNEFSRLSRAQQQAVINRLNAIAKLDDEAVITPEGVDNTLPVEAQAIERDAIKRVKASQRRRARKNQQVKAADSSTERPHFEGALEHEIKIFERRFKDDFHTLVSSHIRSLKKKFSHAPSQLQAEVLGYAHSYMRHTLLSNVPERYRAERFLTDNR